MFKLYGRLIGTILFGILFIWAGNSIRQQKPVDLGKTTRLQGELMGKRKSGTDFYFNVAGMPDEFKVKNLSDSEYRTVSSQLMLGDSVTVYYSPDMLNEVHQVEANGAVVVDKENREGQSHSMGIIMMLAGVGFMGFGVVKFLQDK